MAIQKVPKQTKRKTNLMDCNGKAEGVKRRREGRKCDKEKRTQVECQDKRSKRRRGEEAPPQNKSVDQHLLERQCDACWLNLRTENWHCQAVAGQKSGEKKNRLARWSGGASGFRMTKIARDRFEFGTSRTDTWVLGNGFEFPHLAVSQKTSRGSPDKKHTISW